MKRYVFMAWSLVKQRDKLTFYITIIIIIIIIIINNNNNNNKSRNSSVGIDLGYGMDDRGSRVHFPEGAGNFSLHHRVQNDSGAHPVSYPMGTGGSFLGVKRPGREADHSPPSSAEVKECMELYLHSHNTPSWCGALLKRSTGTTLPFTLPLLLLLLLLLLLTRPNE
jgi:hypothetical protein